MTKWNTAFCVSSFTYVSSNAERRERVKGMGQEFWYPSSPADGVALGPPLRWTDQTLSSPRHRTVQHRLAVFRTTLTRAAPTLSAGMAMHLLARGGRARERVVLMLRFGGSAHTFIKPKSSKLERLDNPYFYKYVSIVWNVTEDKWRCTVWV